MTEQNQTNNAQTISSEEEKLKAKRVEYSTKYAKKKEEDLKAYRKQYNEKNKEKRKARYERLKQEDPEYILKQNRLYRQRHPEKIKAQSKTYNDKTKEKRAQRYQDNKEQEKLKRKQYRETNKEAISAKRKLKRQQNKEAVIEREKEYRKKNKEAINKREKEYRKKNKEVFNKREKEYFHKNKQECVKRNIKYRKERAKRDPLFAAKEKLRKTVHSSFERIKKNKPTNTQTLLGCTWEEAKDHIEALWVEGMSWDNHGVGTECWHIDHIRPVASFGEDELHLMNLIENLQPLWSEDNLRKKDNYEP